MELDSSKLCSSPNCSKACTLRCPDCLRYQVSTHFCSKGCFTNEWKRHKLVHKVFSICQPMLAAMTQEQRDSFCDDLLNGRFARGFYVGERNAAGQKHGHGATYWLNGAVHSGEYFNGRQCGFGTHTQVNGDSYEGNYLNDCYDGEGTYKWADGGTYSGHFKADKFNGHGKRVFSPDSYHEGNYKDGRRSGMGVMLQNGELFTGTFIDELKSEGELKYSNGDRYVGAFANELPNGAGQLFKADGTVVAGPFRNGRPMSGSGAMTILDLQVGAVHTGFYLEGEIISEGMRMNGIHFTLRDSEGESITVSAYNYPGYKGSSSVSSMAAAAVAEQDVCGLKQGVRIRISDPFCKVAMDGQTIIRVDDFKNIRFL